MEPDTEKLRLRNFVDSLRDTDQLEIIEEPVGLAALTPHMDGNEKAVLFQSAGPDEAEIIGNLMAGRARLAAAFGVPVDGLATEVIRRIGTPQPVVEIDAAAAPVQQLVWTGDEADFTRLPVPFQHGRDGAPYFSATLDYVRDPATGLTNVGCRRMMLRGRHEAGVDVTAPSDLRAIYESAAARGEDLPVSFALGSHPADHVSAMMRTPMDETELVARLRGAPLAVVKCVTNDLRVPADAEMIIEGYLEGHGHVEPEGPFGEFMGYYGVMKRNPVFHLTAITQRSDALFHTATISGRDVGRTDTAQLNGIRTEVVVWQALEHAIRRPVAVNATGAGGGMMNVRLSLHQLVPGEARNAIGCIFGSLANAKNVFVVDDDIDVFDDRQMEWALATRFQADRDLVIESGYRAVPIDPSLGGVRVGAKAGFDLTMPFGAANSLAYEVPAPPKPMTLAGKTFDNIQAALEDGPKSFEALMAAIGTRDGRDVVIALEELRTSGRLGRQDDGAYALDPK